MVGGYDVGAAVFAAQHRLSKEDPSHIRGVTVPPRAHVTGHSFTEHEHAYVILALQV